MTTSVKISLSTEHDFDTLERTAAGSTGFAFQGHRVFDGDRPGVWSQQPKLQEDVARGRLSIFSWKPGDWGNYAQAKNDAIAFGRSCDPQAQIRAVCHHEPKDNASDLGGGSTIAGTTTEYKALQHAVREGFDEVNVDRDKGSKIKFWGIWEADAVRAGYADKLWPGDDVWDGLAWDGYAWNRTAPNLYSMAEIFARAMAYTLDKGLPFGIAETSVGSEFSPDRRVAWVRDAMEWLQAPTTFVRFATFWSSTDQFTLSDAALRAIGANAR